MFADDFLILMTCMFGQVVILWGEIRPLSLLRFNQLNTTSATKRHSIKVTSIGNSLI